ncbi:hypothetical protein ACFWXK_25855 [Streptomyces sp. NPDC059070]|uniref:hypothetical protein n=1 Tax=unclassified Streptomyces TaxID=2593676 RepID=UPI0034E2BF01
MDGQWAVVVGAGLGASGAVVGALGSWAGVRLQARGQLQVARLAHAAQRDAETLARKRAAYAELILSVDNARRQMRLVRQHLGAPWAGRGSDAELAARREGVHERIRETQAAEWVLRLMLSDEEQHAVSSLMDAVYDTHQALIDDVEEWLDGTAPDARRPARDTARYAATTGALQARMMDFAGRAHARLYAPAD